MGRSPEAVVLAQEAYICPMTATPGATRRKESRLAMRLTPDQDTLIRDAAAVTGQSLTEFVTTRRNRWRLVRYNDAAHLAGLPAETPRAAP